MYAILFAFVLPFLILILTLILNRDGEPSETSDKSAPQGNNSTDNTQNKTQNKTQKQKASSHYRKTKDKRSFVFNRDAIDFKFENEKLYSAVLSVVALFSWVMRKDGNVGTLEMDVAHAYFAHHLTFHRILSHPPHNMINDPVTGTLRLDTKDCMEMLEYYNTLPRLLRHGKCCGKILEADIYYEASLDLLKALFQVAYSSDGVIDSEMDILRSIAQELKIRREDWNNLQRKYETYQGSYKNRTDSSGQSSDEMGKKSNRKKKNRRNRQRWNESEKSSGQNEERKEQQQKQEEQQGKEQRKSSTFGYKLTQAYNELGLLTTASEAEIKEAFRALAKKYHPDRLPPEATDQERKISADQFRMVKEAYDLIRLERGR
ncbi:MAG: DnaJ domain-containing protein [Paludibacteraceae bacterium]|nr:DnaJ domain-containing protein [Paludibacteraceae bacterium]MBP5481183.1 DnaJ domain-containing protein [Paludibacteraceae bacterium]